MKVVLLLVFVVAAFALHLEEDDALPGPTYYAPTNKCIDGLNTLIGVYKGGIVKGGKNFSKWCESLEIEDNYQGLCKITAKCRDSK
jgi:hypothetical protein